MGSRGPKPKDLSAKKINLAPGVPDYPEWLDKSAKLEFKRVAGLLSDTGVVSLADRAHLTAYAQAWSEFEKLCQELDTEGAVVYTEKGHPMPNPKYQVRDSAHRRMLASASKLGLSVVDRERITQPNKDGGKKEIDEFLTD